MMHSFDIRKETPLVSVFVLAYNHRLYIEECLDGILMQQTSFPFEVIVHDDASTDGTADIVRAYAKKHPNVIVPILQEENQYSQGISPLVTYIRPRVRGAYIAFCEGDDYWTDPNKLQAQVDVLETKQEFSLCFHNAKVIYDGSKRESQPFEHYDRTTYTVEDVIDKWFIPTQSMLIRTSMLEFPFWRSRVYNGDYASQLLASTKGPLYCINREMSVYRKCMTGQSQSAVRPLHYGSIKAMECLDYFDMHSDFKYHDLILAKKQAVVDGLYCAFLYQRPVWVKLMSFDYYKFRIEAVRRVFKEKYRKDGWRGLRGVLRVIMSRLG